MKREIKRSFGLPNGKRTTDVKRYYRAWRDLANPICKLTGSKMHAFDPGVQIRFGDIKDGNVYRFGQVISLPVAFLEKLNQVLKK